jgi:hypothetical protein
MCALSIGCAASDAEFKDRLIIDKIIVLIEFHDDLEALQVICGKDSVGCTQCNVANTYCMVHSIKSQCVIEHEMDHVFFGQFHEGIRATCKYRAL